MHSLTRAPAIALSLLPALAAAHGIDAGRVQ